MNYFGVIFSLPDLVLNEMIQLEKTDVNTGSCKDGKGGFFLVSTGNETEGQSGASGQQVKELPFF